VKVVFCSYLRQKKIDLRLTKTNKKPSCRLDSRPYSGQESSACWSLTISRRKKKERKKVLPVCLTAPSGVTWRHRSRDCLIAHMPFPIGGP